MAFSSSPARNDYLGNGTTAAYDFGFRIFAATDLLVTVRDPSNVETTLLYPTDFTVPTGDVNNPNGGTITLINASVLDGSGFFKNGWRLTIRFQEDLQQPTDFRNQSAAFLEVVEDMFDRVVRFIQQVADVVERSLHLPETEAGTAAATTLPSAADRALKFCAFDAAGNVIATAAAVSTIPISTFMQTVVDDADAAAVLKTLLSGAVSPSQITANQNDYNPASLSTVNVLRITTDASRNITGLSGGVDGRLLFLWNVGSFDAVLKNEDAASTAGNRFALVGDLTLVPNQGMLLRYDGVSSRWRAVEAGIPQGLLTTDGDVPVRSAGRAIRQAGVLSGRVLIGGKITVTMAGNAVTLAIKTDAGNDPSPAEPVWCWMRHVTLTDGSCVLRKITAATSTVISSGSTGGTKNGIASRVYVDLIDNAGTVELAWHQPLDSTAQGETAGSPDQLTLRGFDEGSLVSTTAEGGAGGADSAGVMYSTTARSNVAFRIAGYFESTQATAGTWASPATLVQQMGPGVRRTGDVLQRAFVATTAVGSGTTQIPFDDTIPQITEGEQYMGVRITPRSPINLLRGYAQGLFAHSAHGNQFQLALFQVGTSDALAVQTTYLGANNIANEINAGFLKRAGATSELTFTARAGDVAAGTTTFNGVSGARRFGGGAGSHMFVEEIMV